MPPICGTFFHANLAEVAVSAQVRPRTKLAGAKWIIAVEVYVKAEPCGEDIFSKNTWNIILREWLSSASLT